MHLWKTLLETALYAPSPHNVPTRSLSIWKTLLETALYAPSPHNVQPWRLRIVSDGSADLLLEKQRTLPKEDPTGSFIILTMGLFIEALIILAANHSLKLSYELYAPLSEFTPEHIAEA